MAENRPVKMNQLATHNGKMARLPLTVPMDQVEYHLALGGYELDETETELIEHFKKNPPKAKPEPDAPKAPKGNGKTGKGNKSPKGNDPEGEDEGSDETDSEGEPTPDE